MPLLHKYYVPPFQEKCPFEDVLFVQDNAGPHKTPYAKGLMQHWKWVVPTQPAQSPDLNPQESVWQFMDVLLKGYTIRNLKELWKAVHECWKIAAAVDRFPKYLRGLHINLGQVVKCEGGDQYKENRSKKCINY